VDRLVTVNTTTSTKFQQKDVGTRHWAEPFASQDNWFLRGNLFRFPLRLLVVMTELLFLQVLVRGWFRLATPFSSLFTKFLGLLLPLHLKQS
jgi:hypothetical protein